MMNVLITGASGFVGKNLIQYLKNSGIQHVPVNKTELQSGALFFNKGDTLVNLAGKAHDLKKAANHDEYYQVNYELTKRLYDSFLQSNASKFIFISSVKAAADSVSNILTEEQKVNPLTDYGKSKLMAEEYIQGQPLPAGKSYYILRPCMIHGPGNKGNLNLLYQVVKKGIPYPLAAFDNKRSFLSVENLCFIIKEILVRDDIPVGIYHVADDDALSTNDVVNILSASLNKKAKLWKISPGLIKLIARVGDALHLPLTTERLGKLTESYVVSNKKIKNAVNKPLPLTAKQGLELTARSFNIV